MRRFVSLSGAGAVLAALALLAGCGGTAAAPAGTAAGGSRPVPFKVAVAATSAPYGAYLTAQARGYYTQEGLDVQFEKMTGNIATDALMSGGIQVSTSGTTAMVAIFKGAPLREIYTGEDHTPYFLVARKGIVSAADLRGKKVAVEARGDSGELSTDLYLEEHGLKPTDVTYIPVGYGAPDRLAALTSGAVDAAPLMNLDVNKISKQIAAHEYIVLANYSRDVPLQLTGSATSLAMIHSHPAEIQAFVTATMMGALYFHAHQNFAVGLLVKANPSASRQDALVNYQQILPLSTDNGIGAMAARTNTLRALADYLKLKAPAASAVYDDTFAERARARLKAENWKP